MSLSIYLYDYNEAKLQKDGYMMANTLRRGGLMQRKDVSIESLYIHQLFVSHNGIIII